jgi:hypothetical protein
MQLGRRGEGMKWQTEREVNVEERKRKVKGKRKKRKFKSRLRRNIIDENKEQD